MNTKDTILVGAAVLGAIAAWYSIRATRRELGEAPAANAVSRAADAAVRGTFAFPSSVDNATLGTLFFDEFGPRPSDPPASNLASRSVDKLARAVTPGATPDATLGTILFDVQQRVRDYFATDPSKPSALGNVRAQVGPLLPRSLAIIDST